MIHPCALTNSCGRVQRGGFSLLEAVVASLIVALIFVAAMQTLAASRWLRTRLADRNRAHVLAWELMGEILSKAYEEPETSSTTLGPDGVETTLGRPAFDDVDDYAGWSQSPPTAPDGTALPDLQGWTRSVSVGWVNPADMLSPAVSETGMKRIDLTIRRGQLILARLTAYRSRAASQAQLVASTPTDNRSPIALATISRLQAPVGQSVRFDATGSLDPDGDALTYFWAFSDGQRISGANVMRSFASAGFYGVRLEVWDGRGGLAVREWVLRINSSP